MSTSSTLHPARRRSADSPSFRRAGPENKCRQRGPLASKRLAGGSGGAAAAPASTGGGAGAAGEGSGADRSHFPLPLPLPFFPAFFAALLVALAARTFLNCGTAP
eukprot:7041312-Alexandrium_andersonii.AAC.1